MSKYQVSKQSEPAILSCGWMH